MSVEFIREPRCWWSSTDGYIVATLDEPYRLLRVRDQQVIRGLPEDAREMGASPTQWAYDQACAALKKHRERADNYEGRIKDIVTRMADHLGGDWTYPPGTADLEFLVRTLMHAEYVNRALEER